jgi:hypothetical protein
MLLTGKVDNETRKNRLWLAQGVRYLAGGVQSGLSHYDPEKVRTCFKNFLKNNF